MTGGPHILYRLFDAEGELLYIGITNDVDYRFYMHSNTKNWWPEVAFHTEVEGFETRHDLKAAERDAIAAEHPKYNALYNEGRFSGPVEPPTAAAREAMEKLGALLMPEAAGEPRASA